MRKPNIQESGAWKYEKDTENDSKFLCKNTATNIYNIITEHIYSDVLIDVGCGTGYYLDFIKNINNLNFKLIGIEPLIAEDVDNLFDNILNYDLTVPFTVSPGNVMCIEVLEHIPKKYERIAVENLVNNCNGYLFISWAKIGQGGHGHVNCKNKEEVIKLFESYNFYYRQDLTEKLCKQARLGWLQNNLCCFVKK